MLGLADRWKLPPSVVAGEDASVLQLLEIQRLGTPRRQDGATPGAGSAGWRQ